MPDADDTLPLEIPNLTLGWGVIRHATNWFTQPDGPNAGAPWVPTDRQARFLLWWYAVDESGRWLFHHGVRRLGKGSGKSPFAAVIALEEFLGPVRLKDFDPNVDGGCVGQTVAMPLVQIAATAESQPLDLDTVVPTPAGFRTIGDLAPGDEVFDSSGRPVSVSLVTPVFLGEDCFRVTFDDGDTIVASGSHGWTVTRTNSHDRRKSSVTTTTRQMASDFLQSDGSARYSMPPVSVEFPERDLTLVHPYLLGLWLGDGSTDDASIAFDTDYENEVVRLVREVLEPTDEIVVQHGPGRQGRLRVRNPRRLCRWGHDWSGYERKNGKHIQCGFCLRDRLIPKTRGPILTLRERLRAIGVLGAKHIPDLYLRSSREQRMALLQGLIDSDGTIDAKGRASFVNRDLDLFEQVRQLVVSLGFKTTVLDDPSGAKRLFFNPRDGRTVARLSYKVARQRFSSTGSSRSRYIRNIERVASVPVRCIGIDTEDHLFLVGRNNTLTHNTANTMRMVRQMCLKGSRVAREYRVDVGKTVFYTPTGGQLEVITSSAAAAEGAQVTFAVMDETEHWTPATGGPDLAATLDRNLAKSNSRGIETANAWEPGRESVAESTFEAWRAQMEGRTRGTSSILYDAVVAPATTDLRDEKSLMTALELVYADCKWVDRETIRDRIYDPRTPPDVSRRYYLNQPTASEDAWTTPVEWAALRAAPTTDTETGLEAPARTIQDGEPIVMFFDGSKSRDATGLVGCAISDGHVFTIGAWEPDPKDPDDDVPADLVDLAVEKAFERWDVIAFFADVKEWEGFTKVTWPERYAERLLIHAVPSGKSPQAIAWDMRSHTFDFTAACELTQDEIRERAFTHDSSPVLERHVTNARRRLNRYGVSIAKESKDSPKKIDLAVCMIGARMVRRLVLASSEWQKRQRRGASKGRVIVLSD